MRNEDIIIQAFIDIIEYLNQHKFSVGNELLIRPKMKIHGKYDNDIFFNSGKLLAMFYVFSETAISKEDITYSNGIFYIDHLFEKEKLKVDLDNSCISIAQNIINSSVYNIEVLPQGIEVMRIEDSRRIEDGFVETYKYLVEEKLLLTKIIEEYGHEDLFGEVINKFKILNENDLNRQLKIIQIKFRDIYEGNIFNRNFNGYVNDEFVNLSCTIADELIQSSIIGFYDNNIEITWLRRFKNEIMPLEDKNIYVALLLIYLSENTNNKYYLQTAIQSINPALRAVYLDNYNKKGKEYESILSTLFYINKKIDVDLLKKYIKEKEENFTGYNNSDFNKEKLNALLSKAVNVVNEIII